MHSVFQAFGVVFTKALNIINIKKKKKRKMMKIIVKIMPWLRRWAI